MAGVNDDPEHVDVEPLPSGMIEALRFAEEPGSDFDVIQTHISYVLLTETRVYKFRKAVRFSFLDFSTREARDADCLREVALNRRLAPGVYLGVAPLWEIEGTREVGPVAETLAGPEALEHCVVMRRLPDGHDTQSLLEAGRLERTHVELVARRIAEFHRTHSLGRPAPYAPAEWFERVKAPIVENFSIIQGVTLSPEIEAMIGRIAESQIRLLERSRPVLEARRKAGLPVDGHGDLQLAHVWFEQDLAEPLIIDCTEFNEDFRRIDAASECAFFAMDLRYRGRADLANFFLAAYARENDDFSMYAVLDLYASYRAVVRGKVALLASQSAEIGEAQRRAASESARGHLELALELLEPVAPAALILMCGIVGCGKSTVATSLADALEGVVVSSDRTRKALAGIAATDRSGSLDSPEQGLYSEARSDEVYEGLLERALPVLESGRTAILDASFSRSHRREAARVWAEARGLDVVLVEVRASAEEALRRLARRERAGTDPSDAGPSLHAWSVEHFESTDDWPEPSRIVVDSEDPDWRAELLASPALPSPGVVPAGA